jgi:amino acid transporter
MNRIEQPGAKTTNDPAVAPAGPAPVPSQPNSEPPPPGDTTEVNPKVVEIDGEPPAASPTGGMLQAELESVLQPEESLADKVKTFLIGKPRDLDDKSVFHSLSLAAFLAWVGLGADGLSSSCYGPEEAFKNLGEHTYLAFFLALATIGTVLVISSCYSHIIEEFPSGGGGYLVATKLLGRPLGLVAGCALLVDYVLTITVSIAAAGDALYSLMPQWAGWKFWAEIGSILVLIVLNLRGVKESVKVLMPIFLLFLITHAVLIFGSIFLNLGGVSNAASHIADGVSEGIRNPAFGFAAMLALFLRAYSFGAGTYTGIEAVSNSMAVMREPRVATGKRTMLYMAVSLAATAGGLVIAYLLLGIEPSTTKTMNTILTESFVDRLNMGDAWYGSAFLWAAIISEGALLIVASQAGFIGGPAALATMARDSWVPHWFSNLSERLATHNGVALMGVSALAALVLTGGNVTALVIMYSINVFVTFSLSMIGMCRHWWNERKHNPLWRRRFALFAFGAVLCIAILGVTVYEKFFEGGWRTLTVTGIAVGICFLIDRYYRTVGFKLRRLNEILGQLPAVGQPNNSTPDPTKPTAAILVGGYGGLGIHTFLNTIKFAPNYYKNFLFLSVGVVDSGNFKGARAMDDLRKYTQDSLERYVDLARLNGLPSVAFMAIGTDAVDELQHLCVSVSQQFPRSTFFAGQLVFQRDTWYQRLLHNETAWSLQRRLQWAGLTMVILPTRVK